MTAGMAGPDHRSRCSITRPTVGVCTRFASSMAIVAGSCNVRRLSGLRRHGKLGSSVGLWQLVYCCTCVRRRFVKRLENVATLIAEHGLRQIVQLHAIGATVRSRQSTIRLAAGAELAAPIVAARTRHQPRREPSPPDCADTEERPLRRQRGRGRELGHTRLAHRHLQDRRREPVRLHRQNSVGDSRRPSTESDRGPHSLELRSEVKPCHAGHRKGAYQATSPLPAALSAP